MTAGDRSAWDRPMTVERIREVRRAVAVARDQGKRIGFVPTMGALHPGHGSLIERSVDECDFTVVSIFVNPLQFGPAEDLRDYPRDLESDLAFCRERGVDLVFTPSDDEIYPGEPRTFVEVRGLTEGLCGAFRPGHFLGVTTVVAKLFHIVLPDMAYFGRKDAQQALVISRMVRDLDFPLQVRTVPTVRDADGLAVSSRNRYLTPEEREAATALYRGLTRARRLLEDGERRAEVVAEAVRAEVRAECLLEKQYVEVVDLEELRPVATVESPVLVAAAVYAGKIRLIDNIVFPDDDRG